MANSDRYVVRRRTRDAAIAQCDRLRTSYRDAVIVAGPRHDNASQVVVWSETAEQVERWATWFDERVTWVATTIDAPDLFIGEALMWPADHVHLLVVDPTFHRRGVGRARLAAVEPHARQAGITALTADCSLHSHPVFAACGYNVVEWEDSAHRGEVFRRAKMRKVLA